MAEEDILSLGELIPVTATVGSTPVGLSLHRKPCQHCDAMTLSKRPNYISGTTRSHQERLSWKGCCDYPDMLRERDSPRDEEKAIVLLEESLTMSRELGMRPLMEQVLSRRERLRA